MFSSLSVGNLKILILLINLHHGHSQKPVCTFTPDTSSTYSQMGLQGTALLNSAAVIGAGPSYTIDDSAISLMGMQVTKSGGIGPEIQIDFTVEKLGTNTSPEQVNVTLTLANLATSGGNLTSAYMDIDLGGNIEAYWDAGVPNGAALIDRSKVEYNASNIGVGEQQTLYFKAEPAGEGGIDLPEGQTKVYATLYFTYLGTIYGHILPLVCVERVTTLTESIVYQHGFTALAFFVTFFAAIGLAVLGVWLFLYLRRRRKDATVSPSDVKDRKMTDKGKKIVLDAKAAMTYGANCIKDFSLVAWDDSLVFILTLKDKLQMHREIDNLDILSTSHVDTEIEAEQNEVTVQASFLLIQGLQHNGDLGKNMEDKANSFMRSQLKELERQLKVDYKKDLESVYTDIEARNKDRLGDLLRHHKDQRHEFVRIVRDLKDLEKKKFLDLIDHEQHTKENEVTYKLALEQNMEAEKLRKEYAIRKRIGIKEIQQQYVQKVIEFGQLTVEKSEWLLKQHREQQEEIHKKYDDEISRQRMNLEEKLTRRRFLALTSEMQEDDSTESLNNIASLQLTLLTKLKKSKGISPDKFDEYVYQVQTDLHNVKDRLQRDKEAKQVELVKKLNKAKQKVLADKMNQQMSELNKYVSSNKSQQSQGPVDPLSYVDGLISLKSQHRKELCVLENELDESHAHELDSLRQQAMQKAKDELEALERALIEKLKSEGMSDQIIGKLLADHTKMINKMAARQFANKQNQEAKIRDKLARLKREWEDRRVTEKNEQQDLHQHEREVVDKLLDSQVALSEEERERIFKEHEKQMVMFENSLTLNKLRQKQMLEEKISQRRARQIEELQQKQNAELLKQRKYIENNGEEDEDDTYVKEISLLQKHAEQRISAIQAVDFDIEVQVEQIQVEMMKERALALKAQEERLGALIASLQMNKARQMARIEEQQKAINTLKANLMDDLNARGILSIPECERVLTIHQKEQEQLLFKLDEQRAKQEQVLNGKLQEKLAQREEIMMQRQENEMRTLMSNIDNKTTANIRRILQLNTQMVQMEKFRNKMEREISQTLANTRHEFELQKQHIFQEQEMKFLAGLVKIGNLSQNELVDVLHMLFPGNTEESIFGILGKIYPDLPLKQEGGTKNPKEQRNEEIRLQRRQSTLADRIYADQFLDQTTLHRKASKMTHSPKKSEEDGRLIRKGSGLGMSSRDLSGFTSNSYKSPSSNFGALNDTFERKSNSKTDPTQRSLRWEKEQSFKARPEATRSNELSDRNVELSDEEKGYYSKKQRRFNHNDDDEEDDEMYDSQSKYLRKGSSKSSHGYSKYDTYQKQGRINHNGDDDDDDEGGEHSSDYHSDDDNGMKVRGRQLPPIGDRNKMTGNKKRKKLLRKLAYQGGEK